MDSDWLNQSLKARYTKEIRMSKVSRREFAALAVATGLLSGAVFAADLEVRMYFPVANTAPDTKPVATASAANALRLTLDILISFV